MVKGIVMKILLILMTLTSFSSWAQDPVKYLNNFDSKVYSLKNKGVKDFVVDIRSSKLTKQLNEQKIFGTVKDVVFRTYWTAKPERLDIEVLGLPDGFKEVKDDLKNSVFSLIDNLLPPTTPQRFSGYKFVAGSKPKEIIAKDSTGVAAVQSFILRFDKEDKLVNVEGNKAVGSLNIFPKYEKESFSDGKLVLKTLTTTSSENGQTVNIKKELKYGTSQGMGVLNSVNIETEQKLAGSKAKPLISEETLTFKNYKINSGAAFKHFIGSEAKPTN